MSDADAGTGTDTRNVIEGESGPENIDELDPDAESDVERAARETPPGRPLCVKNLRKEFGGLTAVDDASFDIEAGSLTGLIRSQRRGQIDHVRTVSPVSTRPRAGRFTSTTRRSPVCVRTRSPTADSFGPSRSRANWRSVGVQVVEGPYHTRQIDWSLRKPCATGRRHRGTHTRSPSDRRKKVH